MVSKNFNFLISGNFEKYEGDWIAVSENRVIANGGSASEVMSESRKKTEKKTTIMKVPSKKQILLL